MQLVLSGYLPVLEGFADQAVRERLNHTRSLLEKTYGELAANSKGLAGIVVIFDSADEE
jgi:hypothetical protein